MKQAFFFLQRLISIFASLFYFTISTLLLKNRSTSINYYCPYSYFDVLYTRSQRRPWHPTPVLLPGNSHGRRSLVGYSPERLHYTSERLHFHFLLSCIGEGNGNPLQCSCLENPRDSGAWWASVYGVTQSRTRLKRRSSSSSSSIQGLTAIKCSSAYMP